MGNKQKTILAAVAVVALIGFFWLLLWLRPDPDAPVRVHKTEPAVGAPAEMADRDPSGADRPRATGDSLVSGHPAPPATAPANPVPPTAASLPPVPQIPATPAAVAAPALPQPAALVPAAQNKPARSKSDPARLVTGGGGEYAPFIMGLCLDRDGRLWAGTEDEGVLRGEGAKPAGNQWTGFTHVTTGGADQPEGPTLATLSAGEMALGDDNGYAMACDKLGRIWVGHRNHGVSVYDSRDPAKDAKGHFAGWRNYGALTGPIGERVFAIQTCPVDGDVWMATSAGISRYSLSHETWLHYTRSDGLAADVAQAVAFDAKGNIYVGTQCDGVLVAARDAATGVYKTWRQIKGPDSLVSTPAGSGLPSNLVNDVRVARDGTIFVGTAGGLAWSRDAAATFQFIRGRDWRTKAEQMTSPLAAEKLDEATKAVTPEQLLLEDYVTCLAQDDRGNIWVGHRRQGYELLDSKTLNRVHSSGEDQRTPVEAYDYVTSMAPVPDSAGCWVGWYGVGLTLSPNFSPAPPPDAPALPDPALQVAETPATGLPLPPAAKAPTLAELNALLARLGQIPNEPVEKQPAIVLLNDDWSTEGDWIGRYGRYWACLCAMNGGDLNWGTGDGSPSVSVHAGRHGRAPDFGMRTWVHSLYTDNPSVLELPPLYAASRVASKTTTADKVRRQAEWNDNSQEYPFTWDGPDLYCTVQVPPGTYILSTYHFNKDGHEDRNRFRDYEISVQASGDGVMGGVGDFDPQPGASRGRIRDFWGGQWKRFLVRGPTVAKIKLHRNYSFCTIVSAVMLDPVEDEPAPYFRTSMQQREMEAQNAVQDRKLMDDAQDPALWAKRFAPGATEVDAVQRLLLELDRLQRRNPAQWAGGARPVYAALARWLTSSSAKTAAADEKTHAANLAKCLYQLQLYPAWEQAQKARGLTPAREIEKALRGDGTSPNEQGNDARLVTWYVRQQRINGAAGLPALAAADVPGGPAGDGLPARLPPVGRVPRGVNGGPLPPASAPSPKQYKLELVLDKPEYFLGENVLLHYGLTNISDQPLRADWEYSYGPAPVRSMRFRVQAKDEQGRTLGTPLNSRGGSDVRQATILPGETFWTSLPLMRYGEFDRPGTYTIRVYHDLGWDQPEGRDPRFFQPGTSPEIPTGSHAAPVGEITLKLVMPDAQQARKVLLGAVALSKEPPRNFDPNSRFGRRSADFADFSALHYPVYLPIAAELAQAGEPAAVGAIGAILLPEATKTLIDLCGNTNPAVARQALTTLRTRLPDPDMGPAPARLDMDSWRDRRLLITRTWRPEFAAPARELAWKLFESTNVQDLDQAAVIEKALGLPEDLPRLTKVFDRVCADDKFVAALQIGWGMGMGLDTMSQAAGALIRRGAKAPEKPQTPGEAIVYLAAMAQDYTYRPEGWEATTAALFSHPAAPVRGMALQTVPIPIPEALLPRVAALINDPSMPVSRQACDLARRSHAPLLGEAAAKLLAGAEDPMTVQFAFDAATACGAPRDELYLALAQRLDQKNGIAIFNNFFVRLVQSERGYGFSGRMPPAFDEAFKAKWKAFIEANREQIRSGKLFVLGQPPLTADLIPQGFSFNRADGTRWP